MPITDNQKIENLHKKVILGVASTADGKAHYTEPFSPNTVKSDNVWLDDNDIPTSKPVAPVADQKYDKNGNDPVVSGLPEVLQYKEVVMVAVPGAPDSFIIPNENYALDFNDRNGIYAPIFIDNGSLNVIPHGTNAMQFDANAGVLRFYEGKPAALVTVKVQYWKYIGRTMASAITSLASNEVFNYDMYAGAPDTTVSGDVITLTHNKNISQLNWTLTKNSKQVLPGDFEIVDNNTLKITLSPLPVALDNVKLNLTKIA